MALQLSDIFIGSFAAGQKFGANPDYYKQFGFNGHEGVDWPIPEGTPILAATDGVVIRDLDDAKSGAYGVYVVVWDKAQNCATYYCHLKRNVVSVGQAVVKRQLLGYSGNTGNSTGPHLHFNLCRTDSAGNRIDTANGFKGFLNPLDGRVAAWTLANPVEPVQPPPAAAPNPMQEEIDLGEGLGVLEVQAIRSTILDLRRSVDETITALSGANTQVGILKDSQAKLAELLGCPNEFSEIYKEVKMLIDAEDQHNQVGPDPWVQVAALLKALLAKLRRRGD